MILRERKVDLDALRRALDRARAEYIAKEIHAGRHTRELRRRRYEADRRLFPDYVDPPAIDRAEWVKLRIEEQRIHRHRSEQRQKLFRRQKDNSIMATVVPFPITPKLPAPRYAFETISDLRSQPVAKWLAENWIPEQGVGLFFGDYASGKSFLLFDLLLHLAYGLPEWHGVRLSGVSSYVLLIAREGAQGFRDRIDAFKVHHSITDDTDRIVFMRSPVNFGDVAQFEELKAAVGASGRKFSAVGVDTVGRALPGEDFNDPKSITRFMEHLQQLGEVGGGVAIGVHHVNKSGDALGSIYFGASSDFMFRIEREGDPKREPLRRGKIFCVKMKDGEDGWSRRVDYVKAGPSLVVASVTEGGGMVDKAVKLNDDDKLAYRALQEALKGVGNTRREMPGRSVTFQEWLDQCFKIGGVDPTAARPNRDLHRRQVKLLAAGLILVQDQLVRIIDHGAAAAAPSAIPPVSSNRLPPIPPR